MVDINRRSKDLKVMVANGYYDLISPFLDAESTFARHDIPMDKLKMLYAEGYGEVDSKIVKFRSDSLVIMTRI